MKNIIESLTLEVKVEFIPLNVSHIQLFVQLIFILATLVPFLVLVMINVVHLTIELFLLFFHLLFVLFVF